jgi:hypothetical protein
MKVYIILDAMQRPNGLNLLMLNTFKKEGTILSASTSLLMENTGRRKYFSSNKRKKPSWEKQSKGLYIKIL